MENLSLQADTDNNRYRKLSGLPRNIVRIFIVTLVLFAALFVTDVFSIIGLTFYTQQFLGGFITLGMSALFLIVPASKKVKQTSVPWNDYIMAGLSILLGVYILIWYPRVVDTVFQPSTDKWLFGTIAIILIAEIVRRTFGPVLVGVCLSFLLYALFGNHLPGMFETKATSWAQLAGEVLLGPQGMLGVTFWAVATIVLVFIVFGQLMFDYGGGTFLTSLAMLLMGRFRGGPAKVAVLSSALFGSISGSPVSNVMVTGTVTIPLMKQIGYKPHVAGGIEATASTGGQILPPVMGVVAFIMAEFLQIPYAAVAQAALIPALFYYLCLLIQVDLEAGKTGMKGLSPSQLPKLKDVMQYAWILLPFTVLIVALFSLNYRPEKAGMAAIIVLLIIVFPKLRKKEGLRNLINSIEEAGISVVTLSMTGALVGIVTASVAITGLGFSLSVILTNVGQNNLFLLLLLTAASSIILGMGLPGITIYMFQVVLITPALINLGISPLAAHLFVFYFSNLSMITPPVCIAAFAAATIAKADNMKTGWEAYKLGIASYIIPFLFVTSQSFFLDGPAITIAVDVLTALSGIFAISIAVRGYIFDRVNSLQRVLLAIAAIGLLIPEGVINYHYIISFGCFLLMIFVLLANWKRQNKVSFEQTI